MNDISTRIVFMGSPEFAVPVLQKLAESYLVIGVVTQPDRPAGRGHILTTPPIRSLANDLHLSVIQPHKLSDPEALDQLQRWAPDLIVVAAFGQILRPAVLDLPKFGCVNVHASLLPRWRGAAPIQAAILNGDEITGVTIMRLDPGIDTGPMLSQQSIPISKEDTGGSLGTKLSWLGSELLMQTLPEFLAGRAMAIRQDESRATYAPMIKKGDGQLDFSHAADVLERKIRAYNPWPGAFTVWNGQLLKIHRGHCAANLGGVAGTRIILTGLPAIVTVDGAIVLDELQLSGRKIQSGKAFLNGVRNWVS